MKNDNIRETMSRRRWFFYIHNAFEITIFSSRLSTQVQQNLKKNLLTRLFVSNLSIVDTIFLRDNLQVCPFINGTAIHSFFSFIVSHEKIILSWNNLTFRLLHLKTPRSSDRYEHIIFAILKNIKVTKDN